MGQYATDTCVAIYPFTRQPDGEEIVIGRTDTATFLALPPDAIEILDHLSQGKTVGEAQQIYQQKYGELPDLEEFLQELEGEGFVQPLGAAGTQSASAAQAAVFKVAPTKNAPVQFHFANFPQPIAQRIFSRPVVAVTSVLIVLALLAVAAEPAVLPGWRAYFFSEHIAFGGILVMVIGYITTFFHEMAHLVAARAVGVSSRLGISNRLWVVVAETDMTGVWAIPRNQRYLPMLAGPLLDATCASVLILGFFAAERGLIPLHPNVALLGRVLLMTYLLSLLWQCYFFVRTDFYFVIANFLKCKNLLQDAVTFLRNLLSRVLPNVAYVDQSNIPAAELRAIRWYSLIWIGGRIIALSALFFVSLPLLWNYGLLVFGIVRAGYAANPYGFANVVLMALLTFLHLGLGLGLWIRSLVTQRS
ncbi:MAG: hypothetical protein JOZ51_01660 [Chloroflexi bacterium]|nr:hypothetical protein [Chloroflexota bacterium]